MNHLSTFKSFVREGVDPNEVVTKGAQAKGTSDEELDKASGEANAATKDQAKTAPLDPKKLATPKPGRQLKKGGTEAIARWQEKMNKNGAKLGVDGIWGKLTQAGFVAYTAKKHGADSPVAKKAAAGTAPAEAEHSPGVLDMALNFFNSGIGGLIVGAVKSATNVIDYKAPTPTKATTTTTTATPVKKVAPAKSKDVG